jgi:hypothetical protein
MRKTGNFGLGVHALGIPCITSLVGEIYAICDKLRPGMTIFPHKNQCIYERFSTPNGRRYTRNEILKTTCDRRYTRSRRFSTRSERFSTFCKRLSPIRDRLSSGNERFSTRSEILSSICDRLSPLSGRFSTLKRILSSRNGILSFRNERLSSKKLHEGFRMEHIT